MMELMSYPAYSPHVQNRINDQRLLSREEVIDSIFTLAKYASLINSNACKGIFIVMENISNIFNDKV